MPRVVKKSGVLMSESKPLLADDESVATEGPDDQHAPSFKR